VWQADDDLAQWVADEIVRTKREEVRVNDEMVSRGVAGSSIRDSALIEVKESTLHAYRDQETQAERRRAELRNAEGWHHQLWRKVTRRGPLPQLQTPTKALPIIDDWRLGAGKLDPTRRTLDQALGSCTTTRSLAHNP
jgi:hypothetical protein